MTLPTLSTESPAMPSPELTLRHTRCETSASVPKSSKIWGAIQ